MAVEDQILQSQLAIARQLGELVGEAKAVTQRVAEAALRLDRLDADLEELRRDHDREKNERRGLPDELLQYVREEHARAEAKKKFYGDLRDKLLHRGILGVVGLLVAAGFTAMKQWGPAFKHWLLEQLSR